MVVMVVMMRMVVVGQDLRLGEGRNLHQALVVVMVVRLECTQGGLGCQHCLGRQHGLQLL